MKKIRLSINYRTQVGENLYLVTQQPKGKTLEQPLTYGHGGFWWLEFETSAKKLTYQYRVKDQEGNVIAQEAAWHQLRLNATKESYRVLDAWIQRTFAENFLNTKILDKLTQKNIKALRPKKLETHRFSIQVPIYPSYESIVLLGSSAELGNWEKEKAIKLKQTDALTWEASLNLSKNTGIIEYKYAILNQKTGNIRYEKGENRQAQPNPTSERLYVYHDQNYRFNEDELWKSAGVAVPVFSLRSQQGFGVGEFPDLKPLIDWAQQTKLSIIQLLPINDTTAHHDWTDSYPYAAISVQALHPQYLALDKLSYALPAKVKRKFQQERKKLNALSQIDYEAVMRNKLRFLHDTFIAHKKKILQDKNFNKFWKQQKSWLLDYAVFSTLRDKYETVEYTHWKALSQYKADTATRYARPSHLEYENVMRHAWVQYELHLQLEDAVAYAHSKNIFLKGDLPIGIYRYSVEAWTKPELFKLDFQTGAPPDFYSKTGQNWGFPTYNWEEMKKSNYAWWRERMQGLSTYFDLLRIDHILGFFRIWQIPYSATQASLGYYHPGSALTKDEILQRGINFTPERYVKPYINDAILWHLFQEEKADVIEQYLDHNNGLYSFKAQYDSQRKIENLFKNKNKEAQKLKLQQLLANVLFVEEKTESGEGYHPCFNLHQSFSYQFLDDATKEKLYLLHQDYFHHRQEELWKHSGYEKLSPLVDSSRMLICGEDLGFVPSCVPEVMHELGIAGLKLQNSAPGDLGYYPPEEIGYLNVVTYATHDSATLRQWWKENPELTQRYYNEQLKQEGKAPDTLSPDLAEMVMKQHLYSPAMLAIFPIQEFFATDAGLRNPDEDAERINNPAEFPHYWRYRMHLPLKDLLNNKDFNDKIACWVADSQRSLA